MKQIGEVYKILKFLHTIKNVQHNSRHVIIECLNAKSSNLLFKTIKNTLQSQHIGPKKRKYLSKQLGPYKNELSELMYSKNLKKKKNILMRMSGEQLDIILHTSIPLLLSLIKS